MQLRIALPLLVCICLTPAYAESLRDEAGQARHAGRYADAEVLFWQAYKATPTEAISLDIATILIDQRSFSSAALHLQQHLARYGESEAYWLTKAYFYDRQAKYIDSLNAYDNVLQFNPNNETALRYRIHAVDSIGAPDKAIKLASLHQKVMRDEDWLRLYADSAAYTVRLAGMYEPDRAIRKKNIKEAIRRCNTAIAFAEQKFPDRKNTLQQMRMDRLLVLELDGQHQQVLNEYTALQNENADIRDGVRVAIAQSALHLEKPKLAIAVLEPLIKKRTQDTNARTLYFYAQLENENFKNAQDTINTLVKDEPTWRYGKSPLVAGKNQNRVGADNNAIMLAAWGNTLDSAQSNMEAFQSQAPYNPDLRTALADIYQLRGWTRKSEALQTEALQQDPELYSARAGKVGNRMAMHDYEAAGNITDQLIREYPELKSTENLAEDWNIHNMQEVRATFAFGKSDPRNSDQQNNSGANGSRDLTAELWWFSNPYQYHNRLFFHTSSSTGAFEEGDGQIDRYGIGWEQKNFIGDKAYHNTAEISRSYTNNADYGLSLTTDWQLDDYWSVDGTLETFSSELPVRAYNAGITASSLSGGVHYRVDEGEYYRATLTNVDFSDGNNRWMLGAEGYQVVWSNSHHQWAIQESIYTSSNTQNNTIYFNPEQDIDIGLAAEYQGILERKYDFEFRHTALLGVGMYQQKNYGTKPTAQLTYRHNWKRDKALEWYYGISLNLHPYDGNQELHESLFGGLIWHFD